MALKQQKPEEMSIGALANELQISTASINFYVKEGIIPPPRKLNRTRAAYSTTHQRLLRLLKRMQGSGYSLAQVKQTFAFFGADKVGIEKLEGIGYLHPMPPVRNDPDQQPIEPFDPLEREAFIERFGLTNELVQRLEDWGILRPVVAGRYDARDAWVARTIKSFLDDGVPLEWLEQLRHLPSIARSTARVISFLMRRYAARLASRELRVRDLWRPLSGICEYVFVRVHDELNPDWRTQLFQSFLQEGPGS